MKEDPLSLRLYFQPVLSDLARFISYGGKRPDQVRQKCEEMAKRFAPDKVTMALHELTTADDATGLTVLRPHVRPFCRQLLGPPPESPDYAEYYKVNRREPPADHQPPPPLEAEAPAEPKKARKGRGR